MTHNFNFRVDYVTFSFNMLGLWGLLHAKNHKKTYIPVSELTSQKREDILYLQEAIEAIFLEVFDLKVEALLRNDYNSDNKPTISSNKTEKPKVLLQHTYPGKTFIIQIPGPTATVVMEKLIKEGPLSKRDLVSTVYDYGFADIPKNLSCPGAFLSQVLGISRLDFRLNSAVEPNLLSAILVEEVEKEQVYRNPKNPVEITLNAKYGGSPGFQLKKSLSKERFDKIVHNILRIYSSGEVQSGENVRDLPGYDRRVLRGERFDSDSRHFVETARTLEFELRRPATEQLLDILRTEYSVEARNKKFLEVCVEWSVKHIRKLVFVPYVDRFRGILSHLENSDLGEYKGLSTHKMSQNSFSPVEKATPRLIAVPFPTKSEKMLGKAEITLPSTLVFPLKKEDQKEILQEGKSLVPKAFYTLNVGKHQNHFIVLLFLLHKKLQGEISDNLAQSDYLQKYWSSNFREGKNDVQFVNISFTIKEFSTLYGSTKQSTRQLKILDGFLDNLKKQSFVLTVWDTKYKVKKISLNLLPYIMVDYAEKRISLKIHPLFFSLLPIESIRLDISVFRKFKDFLIHDLGLKGHVPNNILSLICHMQPFMWSPWCENIFKFHIMGCMAVRKRERVTLVEFWIYYLKFTYPKSTFYMSTDGKFFDKLTINKKLPHAVLETVNYIKVIHSKNL